MQAIKLEKRRHVTNRIGFKIMKVENVKSGMFLQLNIIYLALGICRRDVGKIKHRSP